MKEIYKKLKGFTNEYYVSNLGNVKSIKTNSILKPQYRNGYPSVNLLTDKYRLYSIHRLVSLYFITNPNNYPQVNHKDGNKSNNCVNNLEWCTNQQNATHAKENNLRPTGYNHWTTNIKETDVPIIIKCLKVGLGNKIIADNLGYSIAIIKTIKAGTHWLNSTKIVKKAIMIKYNKLLKIEELILEELGNTKIHEQTYVSSKFINAVRNGDYNEFKQCFTKYFNK